MNTIVDDLLIQFFNALSDHVFLMEHNEGAFRLVATNDSMARFFGARKEEIQGLWLHELVTDPALLAKISARYREVAQTGRPLRYQEDSGNVGETLHYFDTVLAPLCDEQGRCVYICGMSRNVTERALMDKALREANERLETQLAHIRVLEHELREQTIRDPLTDLYNRRYLEETLPRELARSEREGEPVALVMIDVDDFKRFNDRHGHPAGDEALRRLSSTLQAHFRAGDIACRFGGEEFVVVQPGMDTKRALERAETWRRAVENCPIHYEGAELRITLSAGVAAFPADADSPDALIRAADRALYNAKSTGRNQVLSFDLKRIA